MLGIKQNFLNLIRGIYEKPTDNIILNGKIWNFPHDWVSQKDGHSHHFFSILFRRSLANELREEEIKVTEIRKEVKLLLFAGNMIMHM